MADAAVTFLMENVSRLLQDYWGLISGAENELELLQNELALLKGFLEEAANKQVKEEPFRVIERQIRKVVFEVEDTIDTCLTNLAAVNSRNIVRRSIEKFRVDLPQEVRSIRQNKVKPMFDNAKMEFAKIEISHHGSGTSLEQQRPKIQKAQTIRQDNIVGFEDQEEMITGYLMDQKEKLDVISIIGMPGLGKTTLAWKIYQSKKTRHEFPVCIWVYVSQAFSKKEVFLKILNKFISHDMSHLSEEDLIEKVREHLGREKFFLVLDDVWSVAAWNELRVVLPNDNWMSKVLITSRYTTVGKHSNPAREPHNLRFLTKEESWKLLQLEVFGKEDVWQEAFPDRRLGRIGESIAIKCDGLPLAIVVIGGILLGELSTKQTMNVVINKWTEVSKNVTMYLVQEQKEKEKGITDIVSWSYSILPHDLKDCFLYLGVFPEDYEIPVWTLTRLWIAEGFIQHMPGQSSSEEIAQENLKDLIARNLVMVEKTNLNGEVRSCRVHDVIRAFCISKAAINDQNLFQEIKISQGAFDPPVSEIKNYRRLCVHSNVLDFLSGKPRGPGVRSFLSFNTTPVDLEAKLTPVISDAFKLLRVLNSMSIKFKQFPKGVTKLIHLRYITVTGDDIDSLPEAISELWNLQTLVIETHSSCLKIEANIWRMIQLRHLKTKAAIILVKKGDGNAGENLQTLSRLSPDCCTMDVFTKARNLKKLGIRGKLAPIFEAKSVEYLSLLEKLKLVNDGSKLHRLPESSWFPPYLMQLTISATLLDWEHMSTLGKIDTLQVLKLKSKAFTGDTWEVVGGGFRKLHLLLIDDTNIIFWVASEGHFPCLSTLVLNNCGTLKEIPLCLAKTLHKLDIENLDKTAVESAKQIEEKKKEMHGQANAGWRGGFKLSIGPGCAQK